MRKYLSLALVLGIMTVGAVTITAQSADAAAYKSVGRKF